MLWLGAGLIVVAVALFFVGFVLYANGAGVAPQRRTGDDPTGIKRANSRVAWPDVFRRMPGIPRAILDKETSREDRQTALGSLSILAALVAALAGILALIAALV